MSKRSRVWIIEARLENTRESVATARFGLIEEAVGERGDAERRAQEYLDRRLGGTGTVLEWIDGTNGKLPARYAFHPAVTFRITAG